MRRPAGLMIGLLLISACTTVERSSGTTRIETIPPVSGTEPLAETRLYDVSALVKEVRPGIVTVSRTEIRLDMLFEPEEVAAGTGSGFVIDDNGHIVTNFHVIAGAENVFVLAEDGQQRQARVIGGSQFQDIAVLEVEDFVGLVKLELGSSAAMEVGNPVIAIGNALGLDATSPTVSVGILSAKGREINVQPARLFNALQTDAAINPGNSGGPLLNEFGQVIGINSAVAQGAENVGFAIAIDEAKPIIENILSRLGRPFIGVTLRDNDEDIASRFGLGTDTGAIVIDVLPGGPADEAGVRFGDIIVEIDGVGTSDSAAVTDTVYASSLGSDLELTIVRGDTSGTVQVSVEER